MPEASNFFTVGLSSRYAAISSAGVSTLAQAIYLSGLFVPPPLCSGLGRCGRCRVRYLPEYSAPAPLPEEKDVLNETELREGWRLGCLRAPEDGLELSLPSSIRWAKEQDARQAENAEILALAVDFGSTSVQYAAIDPARPERLACGGKEVNPQMGAGGDIMSRMAFAASPQGFSALHELSLSALRAYVQACGGSCREICLAANPAMTCIALGKDLGGLTAAPYKLSYYGGVTETLPELPPVWTAPLISPFIGGDISAGYASIALAGGFGKNDFPFLLADMGTNGEFLLALGPDESLAASVPLGPALEGIGLSCGTEAREGAITGFTLEPSGLKPIFFSEGRNRRDQHGTCHDSAGGISASGYLQLLHILRKTGLMTPNGQFAADFSANPQKAMAARLGKNFFIRPNGESAFRLASREPAPFCTCPACMESGFRQNGSGRNDVDFFLSAGDVEELLKIKAAFSLAFATLLKTACLPLGGLKKIYLAGALGQHAPQDALEELGFLPRGLGGKLVGLGNSSLAGARLLLARPELRPALVEWSRKVTTLPLAEEPYFMEHFINNMSWDV